MQKAWKLCSILLLIGFIIFLVPHPIKAQSDEELDNQLREKQNQIKDVEKKLEDTQKQEKTLQTQLETIDNQTTLTELKIEETNFQITKLDREISDLEGRLTRVSGTVDNLSQVLLNNIVDTYKQNHTSTFEMFLSSHSFAELQEQMRYLQVIQTYQKKQLYELQATKAVYNEQRDDKQSRQLQQEKLKKNLETYTNQLAEQKKAKEAILKVTQNDEKNFQNLLAKLRADTESIARALAGRGARLGPVKKGERIASVGMTGCTTGPHLHLEVMTPAHVENGIIIGRENKVDPLPYITSGKFAKPVVDYSGNDCSQGGTCNQGDVTTRFGQVYFLGTHTGLDIADYKGASIYAVMDGTAYATQDSRACYLTGTAGKGIFVDHGNDIVTLYWHIP